MSPSLHPPYPGEFSFVQVVLGVVLSRRQALYTPLALASARHEQEVLEVTKTMQDAPLLAPIISR